MGYWISVLLCFNSADPCPILFVSPTSPSFAAVAYSWRIVVRISPSRLFILQERYVIAQQRMSPPHLYNMAIWNYYIEMGLEIIPFITDTWYSVSVCNGVSRKGFSHLRLRVWTVSRCSRCHHVHWLYMPLLAFRCFWGRGVSYSSGRPARCVYQMYKLRCPNCSICRKELRYLWASNNSGISYPIITRI